MNDEKPTHVYMGTTYGQLKIWDMLESNDKKILYVVYGRHTDSSEPRRVRLYLFDKAHPDRAFWTKPLYVNSHIYAFIAYEQKQGA